MAASWLRRSSEYELRISVASRIDMTEWYLDPVVLKNKYRRFLLPHAHCFANLSLRIYFIHISHCTSKHQLSFKMISGLEVPGLLLTGLEFKKLFQRAADFSVEYLILSTRLEQLRFQFTQLVTQFGVFEKPKSSTNGTDSSRHFSSSISLSDRF